MISEIGQGASSLFTMGSMIVIARLVIPEQVGLVGHGSGIHTRSGLCRDIGCPGQRFNALNHASASFNAFLDKLCRGQHHCLGGLALWWQCKHRCQRLIALMKGSES